MGVAHLDVHPSKPDGPITVVDTATPSSISQEEQSIEQTEEISQQNQIDELPKDFTPTVFDKPPQIKSDAIWDDFHLDPNPKKWWGQNLFTNRRERNGFILYMIPIVIMSTVSMFSLVNFFTLGHPTFSAWLLGIAFEGASMATVFAMISMRKLKKTALWTILILLYGLQILGNVYATFAHLNPGEATPLFDLLGLNVNGLGDRRIVAILEGLPLPTIALVLFKLIADYFKGNDEKQ